MRRVPEVLDCWFESGSMPFAQVHYPFENADWFESHYPGDFIVEYTGQTRGWFYTLHVLATALFDRPAFQHVRQPRHRPRRRRPEDVEEPAQLPGPDGGVRPPRRRRHALVPAVVADPARQRLLGDRRRPARHRPPGAAAAVERLVLPRALRQRRRASTAASATARAAVLDERARPLRPGQDPPARRRRHDGRWTPTTCSGRAPRCGRSPTTLTNWYIRRSRQRFWDGDVDAIDTLHTVLDVVVRVAAPLLPFVAEEIHDGLHAAARPAQRAPARLARCRRAGRRRRPRARHGRGARRVLGHAVGAQGPRPPRAPAAGDADGRRARRRGAGARSSTSSPTRSTSARCTSPTTSSAVAGHVLQVVPAAIGPAPRRHTQHVIRAVKAGRLDARGRARSSPAVTGSSPASSC